MFVDLNNTKTNLSSNKEIAEENKLEYVQTCMRLTALYDIDDTILDRIKDDNQVQDTIIEAIKAEREENEDDKKRSSIGIGESFTLTLTGKPMGDIKKLTWAFVSGKELVEEIGEDKLKGTAKITLSSESRIPAAA